jgi:hypothetical protein
MPRAVLKRQAEILVSMQQAADALLISRQKLLSLINEGVLTRHSHGRVDLLKITPQFLRHRDQQQAAANADSAQTSTRSFSDSRADLYRTRAQREELELAQMRGEMLDANEVTKAIRSGFTTMRQLLMGSGARLAPQLALINSPTRIQSLIDDENSYVLTQFATAPVIVDHIPDAERGDGADVASGAVGVQAAAASNRKRVG